MLGLDAPSKVDATLQVEFIVRALEDTLVEFGIADSRFRPVLCRVACFVVRMIRRPREGRWNIDQPH
jgi:hypothetical protein